MEKKKRGDGILKSIATVFGSIASALATACRTSIPPTHLGAKVAQRIERVGDVFRAERLAVAPADAGTRLDRQVLEFPGKLVALGEPHRSLVGEGAAIRQRFVNQVRAILVVGADRVRVPEIPVDPASLAAAPYQDHRPVARHRRELGPRCAPWHERRRTDTKPGLYDLAAAKTRREGGIGHGFSAFPPYGATALSLLDEIP